MSPMVLFLRFKEKDLRLVKVDNGVRRLSIDSWVILLSWRFKEKLVRLEREDSDNRDFGLAVIMWFLLRFNDNV